MIHSGVLAVPLFAAVLLYLWRGTPDTPIMHVDSPEGVTALSSDAHDALHAHLTEAMHSKRAADAAHAGAHEALLAYTGHSNM